MVTFIKKEKIVCEKEICMTAMQDCVKVLTNQGGSGRGGSGRRSQLVAR